MGTSLNVIATSLKDPQAVRKERDIPLPFASLPYNRLGKSIILASMTKLPRFSKLPILTLK